MEVFECDNDWHADRCRFAALFVTCQRIGVLKRSEIIASGICQVADRDLESAVRAENESFNSLGSIPLFQQLADQLSLAEEIRGRMQLDALPVDHDHHLPELEGHPHVLL